MGRGRRRATKRHEEIWGDEYVTISMVVVVSWVYADVKTHQLYTLNMCSLSYVSYTLVKLFRRNKTGMENVFRKS